MTKIHNEVKDILYNIMEIDISNCTEEMWKKSLLEIGLLPRDIFVLFNELEKYYNIKFIEDDIIKRRFDMLDDIVESIKLKGVVCNY